MSIPSIDAARARYAEARSNGMQRWLCGGPDPVSHTRMTLNELNRLIDAWEGWPRALFYVCKAMGPPQHIAWRNGWDGPVAARDPVESAAWWAWFDAAQAWVEGINQ